MAATSIFFMVIIAVKARSASSLDFVNVLPPQALLVSRVITSPGHFKRIIAALSENLKKYEAAHGKVEAASEPDREIGFRAA